tara:strand:- start:298 stop:483 length:186 start_codon:yes stop_codon:yes gene_type:complete
VVQVTHLLQVHLKEMQEIQALHHLLVKVVEVVELLLQVETLVQTHQEIQEDLEEQVLQTIF